MPHIFASDVEQDRELGDLQRGVFLPYILVIFYSLNNLGRNIFQFHPFRSLQDFPFSFFVKIF